MSASPIAHVDGQSISVRDMADAVQRVETALATRRGFTLFTLNLDHLVKRRRSAAFRDAYTRATHVAADGWPVVTLAARAAPGLTRTTGADLVAPLCRMAVRRGVPVYLYGSAISNLVGAALELRRLCPGLDIRELDTPPFGFDPTSMSSVAAACRIAESGAKLCFVGLGAPKQEIFADVAHAICPDVGFICVGEALDVLAGVHVPVPGVIQAFHLEWAWRLMRDPHHLCARYLRCSMLFVELILGAARSSTMAR